jgi:hypothetical protein
MTDATKASTTVTFPLAVPLPTVLDRLRAATVPPHWTDQLVSTYLVSEIGHQELSVRRSHTYRSLGMIEFRAPLDNQARQLTGTFHLTLAAKVFWALWSLFWLTGTVLTIVKDYRSPATPGAFSPGAAVVICCLCLGLAAFLARVPTSDRHPQRGRIVTLLKRVTGATAS